MADGSGSSEQPQTMVVRAPGPVQKDKQYFMARFPMGPPRFKEASGAEWKTQFTDPPRPSSSSAALAANGSTSRGELPALCTIEKQAGKPAYKGQPGGLTGGRHAGYFALIKQGGSILAIPLERWYDFKPHVQRESLSTEEAEALMKDRRLTARAAAVRYAPAHVKAEAAQQGAAGAGKGASGGADDDGLLLGKRAGGAGGKVKKEARDDVLEDEDADAAPGPTNAAANDAIWGEDDDERGAEGWDHEEGVDNDDLEMAPVVDEAMKEEEEREKEMLEDETRREGKKVATLSDEESEDHEAAVDDDEVADRKAQQLDESGKRIQAILKREKQESEEDFDDESDGGSDEEDMMLPSQQTPKPSQPSSSKTPPPTPPAGAAAAAKKPPSAAPSPSPSAAAAGVKEEGGGTPLSALAVAADVKLTTPHATGGRAPSRKEAAPITKEEFLAFMRSKQGSVVTMKDLTLQFKSRLTNDATKEAFKRLMRDYIALKVDPATGVKAVTLKKTAL